MRKEKWIGAAIFVTSVVGAMTFISSEAQYLNVKGVLEQPNDYQLCININMAHVYCQELCKKTNGKWSGRMIGDLVKNSFHCECQREGQNK